MRSPRWKPRPWELFLYIIALLTVAGLLRTTAQILAIIRQHSH
jgi:hypothetical protein